MACFKIYVKKYQKTFFYQFYKTPNLILAIFFIFFLNGFTFYSFTKLL